jgi:O-antigen ligase
LNGALLILAIMLLVSIFVTYSLDVSLPKIVGLIFGLSVYFAVIRVCDQPHAWVIGLSALCLVGLGAAVVGLLGATADTGLAFAYTAVDHWRNLIDRLLGLAHAINPNEVAGALLWVVSPAGAGVWVLWQYQSEVIGWVGVKWYRVAGVALAALSLVVSAALGLTLSRASYIGVLVTGWILLAVKWPPRRRWIWWLGSVVAVGAILVAVAFNQNGDNNRLLTAAVGSVNDRLELYSRALFFFQNFAWTGMGLNTFVPVTHTFFPMQRIGPQQPIGDAHNEYLQAGLDLGFPGLIAFLAVNLGAAFLLWRILQTDQHRAPHRKIVRGLALGLGGSLLAHFIYGLADAVALGAKVGFIFWLLLGLVASLYEIATRFKAESI